MADAQRFNYRALLALGLAMFTMAMGIGFIIPLLPVYSSELGAGGLWIGLIFGVNPAVRSLVMPLFGRLSDARGKRRFLLIGLLGSSLVALLMAVAVAAYQLLLLRALQGVFSAMVMPISRAYVGVLAPRGREGSVMGTFNLSFFLGFSLGPLVGGLLSDAFGLRMPFFCMAAMTALALAIVAVYVPEQVGTLAATARLDSSGAALDSPVMRGLILGRAFNAMGRSVFVTLLPLYAAGVLLLTQTQIGFLVSFASLFSSSLQPLSGALADRMSRKRLALAGFLLSPLGLLMVPSAQSFSHLLGIGLVMGLSPGLFVPASTAMAVVEGRRYGMGSTMALVEMSMSVGMALGSTLGGAVAQYTDVPTAFYWAAATTLVGAAGFLWYLRHYRGEQEGAVVEGCVTR